MFPQLLNRSFNLRMQERPELLITGLLLLAGAAGCTGARTQTSAANSQSEVRISRGPSTPVQGHPSPEPAEEYPDFRGRRRSGQKLLGPQVPYDEGRGAPAEELGEPPPFPGVEDQDNGGPAASRSRGVPRQLLGGASRRPVAQTVAMPVSERRAIAVPATPAVDVTRPVSRPARDVSVETTYAPLGETRRAITKPPAWSLRYQSGRDENSGSVPQILASTTSPADSAPISGSEPVRMEDPPRLNSPPSNSEAELLNAPADEGLEIARILICRQVRGFDDVVEFDAQNLRQGQAILVYASLEKYLSIATGEGYRTQTLSSLEIQTLGGEVLIRMPLGTAVDLAETPRQQYFLTHRVTIPENLPAGHYVFELRIDDVQSRESAREQVHVTITEDRSRRDETGGTSKFATRPDSFLR